MSSFALPSQRVMQLVNRGDILDKRYGRITSNLTSSKYMILLGLFSVTLQLVRLVRNK